MSLADALITLQQEFATLHAPSAEPFLQRAALLVRLGQTGLALRDAQLALLSDPGQPRAQALICQLAPGAGQAGTAPIHRIALDLLASPFATAEQRRLALMALDPQQLPLGVVETDAVRKRLTLVQRATDRIALTGTAARDLPEPLARANLNGIEVTALDYHLMRPTQGQRRLRLGLNDRDHPVSVDALAPPLPQGRGQAGPPAPLWIVMPVKDGGQVLQDCLASVRHALDGFAGARLVLVDDCSTTPQARALLAAQARHPGTRLVRTPRPLGFTGAVNLGLAEVGPGPVLLLNADVWLPEGALERLLAHLQAPDIGTVTPLSNNAGGLSLLGPGRASALPPPEICGALDRAAARVNAGQAIDLPNGNGFCMLIAPACLDAVGPLSQHYESGYYEEVDFCLRASLLGYRHVAAMDCFVGHAGSVSYGAAKHRLVSMNRRRLHRRFPEYPGHFARFAAFDPLRDGREAVLRAVPGWRPVEELPHHPGLAAAGANPAELTLAIEGPQPILLPVRGDLPPAPWLTTPHPRLRPVPETRLAAAGLRLRGARGLWAEWRADRLWLGLGSRAPVPGPDDPAALEPAVLALLDRQNPAAATGRKSEPCPSAQT